MMRHRLTGCSLNHLVMSTSEMPGSVRKAATIAARFSMPAIASTRRPGLSAAALVLDCLMQELGHETPWITPGLTPLAGAMPWW